MPELVTLTEDGPLGKTGEQVWVNSADDVKTAPRKSTPPRRHPGKGVADEPGQR